MAMDPVTCPMCDGAIPGNEIQIQKTCPSCGADLAVLIRRRLAKQPPTAAPVPQPSRFIPQAASFSLLAPCFGIAVNLFGHGAVRGSQIGMLVLGAVCCLFIVGGFLLGIIAFFAPKSEDTGTRRKAIAGICINGLIIAFAILSIFAHQKVAASQDNPAGPSRKSSSYISGK